MGYGLRVYLVNAEDLRPFPGKGDKLLLKEILETRADEIADLNDWFMDELEDICPDFSLDQALKEIFTGKFSQAKVPPKGKFSDSEAAFIYGWAFDLLCSSIGDWVHAQCDRWNPDWLEILDKTLARGKIDLQINRKLISDCPVKIPDGGIPGIGHWTHAEMMKALPLLQKLQTGVDDDELSQSLVEIHGWLKAARKRPDAILVGVYG